MSRNVVSLPQSASVLDALKALAAHRISCVVVLDDRGVCGIASERGLAHVIAERGAQALTLGLGDVTRGSLPSLSGDLPLSEALRDAADHPIGRWVVLDSQRRPLGVITRTDLVKASREALEGWTRELEERVRERTSEKDELLGFAAHDLRSPLSVIDMSLQLLEDPALIGDAATRDKIIQACKAQVTRLLDLIDDLLDVSKIEAGRVQLKIAEMDLADLVRQLLTLYTESARKKGIALTAEGVDAPCRLRADATYLGNILANLLSNAIKFSSAGDHVTVRLIPDGALCHLEVEDTGQGLPAEEVPRLFEKFRRLSASPTGGEPSTGLGLAIVKKLVEMHGGRIQATSTLGEGSTFVVSLPVAGP